MLSQFFEILTACLLAIGAIWALISGFDDNDNDGNGMTYSALQTN